MKSKLNSFQKVYRTASDLIDKACQPNPKYIPSVSQQQVSHKRNKAIFISYIGLFICFTCDLFLTKGPTIHDLMTLVQLVITVVSMVLSCQYHPEIFKCVYNFEVAIYGPIILYVNPKAIFLVLILGQIMPLCVHLITGSYRHFFLQAVIQFVLINTYYQDFIAKMLTYSTSEEILHSLIHSGSLSYIIQFSVLIGMGGYIDMACQQAVNLEMKKNEAEKQKIFLLSFSHELRNLINSLTGNVKLASLENIGFKARDLLLSAEVCGELLLHMINNILDTGKSEIGELEVDMSPTRAYDTFEKIWAICSELIRRKDLRGYMKIPKNLPRVLVMDHHRLTQIFLNLVGNSIKFTNKGSINITVQWLADETCVSEGCFKPYPFNHSDEQDEGLFEKQQIFNSLSEELLVLTPTGSKVNQTQLKIPDDSRRGVLKLIVSDTGCGMTQSQVEKLFQKFSQVTLDASKKKLGTGLGLFISKELCNKMGGEIRVYSQKDKGTSFIICLPTEQIKEDERQIINNWEIARAMLAQRRLKVMIVDDMLLNHDILKNFFAALDITVSDIALNGLEAARKYSNYIERGEQLDIVTMDLDMPIMNGKEAAQKIREIEKDKELQPCFLLIISGNCIESEIKECVDQGGRIRADAFLRKPIKIEDLTRIVVSRFGSNQS